MIRGRRHFKQATSLYRPLTALTDEARLEAAIVGAIFLLFGQLVRSAAVVAMSIAIKSDKGRG
jgi:hypothetical protein